MRAAWSRMTRMEGASTLEQSRKAYAKRAWLEAYDSLTAAHGDAPLAPQDLELVATTAFMLGRG
jgi:hypothetical protein